MQRYQFTLCKLASSYYCILTLHAPALSFEPQRVTPAVDRLKLVSQQLIQL